MHKSQELKDIAGSGSLLVCAKVIAIRLGDKGLQKTSENICWKFRMHPPAFGPQSTASFLFVQIVMKQEETANLTDAPARPIGS